MSQFQFQGEVPASQSLMCRALIVKSYYSEFQIIGQSEFDEVILLQKALANLQAQKPIDCGSSGTLFRTMALRASRVPGRHVLMGSEQMLAQQQRELMQIASQLSVQVERNQRHVTLTSDGWRLIVDGLHIHSQRPSAWASALILNAWELPYPLHFNVGRQWAGEGYLRMTIQLMRKLGLHVEANGAEHFIPARQIFKPQEYRVEPDMTSAFFIAAMAAVNGHAVIHNFPNSSLQPDMLFVNLLRLMGVAIRLENQSLWVEKSPQLTGGVLNLEGSPDLFPVVAVLCAMADSPSQILGVGQLRFKESSRLEKTKELLGHMGAVLVAKDDRVEVIPSRERDVTGMSTVYQTERDSRLFVAAQVAQKAGYLILIDDRELMNKMNERPLWLAPGAEV